MPKDIIGTPAPNSSYFRNENRAHIGRTTLVNWPTPMNADGGVASANPPNALPPGILNSGVPMMKDSHAAGRHSYDNMTVKPGEKSRAAESAETRRRLANPGKPTDTYR
jgi:hypothetical protein